MTGAGPNAGARPGELVDRFLARLIDGVLLAVVYVFAAVIVGGAVMGDRGGLYGSGSGARAAAAVLGAVIYLGYFTIMESTRGQTVGKTVRRLHTLGPAGGKPTVEQSVRRNIWVAAGILGVIPVVGNTVGGLLEFVAVIMIAVGINKDAVHRQAWHDHFAGGTRVVKDG